MAKELYEHCPICYGEGCVPAKLVAGADPDNRGMAACPECDGECYVKVGTTVGDLERLKAERDRLKAEPSDFQARVRAWVVACFGPEVAENKAERCHRFLEESLELVQSLGIAREDCLALVEYVYGRPAGLVVQEVGGVMITLAALCSTIEVDMRASGETELARVWAKSEEIRAKWVAKPKRSPLLEQVAAIEAPATPGDGEGETDGQDQQPEVDRLKAERAAERAKRPAAIVIYRVAGVDHAELFAAEADAINRYEQVDADNVRIFLAFKDVVEWKPATPGDGEAT